VANPTFEMLAHRVFPGTEHYTVREAIQQSHIDEVWHIYMHMTAMNRTQAARGLTDEPDYSYPVTNRRLFRLAGQEEIIADTRSAPGTEPLLTDFATVHCLVRELVIEDEVDYDLTHVSSRAATAQDGAP
jgi:hypothetical protein